MSSESNGHVSDISMLFLYFRKKSVVQIIFLYQNSCCKLFFCTFAAVFSEKNHHIESINKHREIVEGLRLGLPIGLGYFAVAFSLGIIAKKAGLTVSIGFMSSFFTRASAGEYGVYTLVAAGATYAELVAMCLVTNLRYTLMSAALSQKLSPATRWYHRLLMACCITDEIFGISIAHPGYTPPVFTYSAAFISTIFWASGCAVGIMAGGMLPASIVAALSVALYGMFLAIIVPPGRQDRNVLYTLIVSFLLSGLCTIVPVVNTWSSGMRTVVLTVLIASVAAWLKPIKVNVDGEA